MFATNVDSDQTVQMHRLIWVIADCMSYGHFLFGEAVCICMNICKLLNK